MQSYWLDWKERDSAGVDANDAAHAAALATALTGFAPSQVRPIYYRGLPVLLSPSVWPPYCLQPKECAGHTRCMRSPACDS